MSGVVSVGVAPIARVHDVTAITSKNAKE